jgi:hypothetical protein
MAGPTGKRRMEKVLGTSVRQSAQMSDGGSRRQTTDGEKTVRRQMADG